MKAIRKYPDYAAFTSRQLTDQDAAGPDGDGDVVHVSGLIWRDGHGRSGAEHSTAPREVFSSCASALYRREALQSVGGFDEDFFCYAEDVDLGFRLRLKGYRCIRQGYAAPAILAVSSVAPFHDFRCDPAVRVPRQAANHS